MIRQFFDNSGGVISLPRLREAHPERGLIYCLRFIFFFFIFNDFRPTNYLNSYCMDRSSSNLQSW